MSEQLYVIKWDHDPAKGQTPWAKNIRPLSFAQAEHVMDRAEVEGGFSGEIVPWETYLADTGQFVAQAKEPREELDKLNLPEDEYQRRVRAV